MTTARWQAVWITLSDGTIAKFVGPAVVEEGDTRTITKIQFTAPAEMPAGCGFEEITPVMNRQVSNPAAGTAVPDTK